MLQGKTEDEIYLSERNRLDNQAKASVSKPTGYIAPEEYEQRKNLERRTSSNIFLSENSMDSFGLMNNTQNSQSCDFLNQISQNSFFSNTNSNLAFELPTSAVKSSAQLIEASLPTSTSKNSNSVLCENIDSDIRQKSAQKNLAFSGKDQKNISPYNDRVRTTSLSKQPKLLVGGSIKNANLMKAKRQISFDA